MFQLFRSVFEQICNLQPNGKRNLIAMASNLLAMASNLAIASNLLAKAYLIALASTLLAMASSLLAMASNPINWNVLFSAHLLRCFMLCLWRI